jgi:hypothetical protein
VAKLYGMLPAEDVGRPAGRTAADNQTVRNVFVIGPDKKIKLILTYPMTTGRNFDEVLRVIDSLQLTAKHKVATPVNWKPGEDVIIAGSVSDEERLEVAESPICASSKCPIEQGCADFAGGFDRSVGKSHRAVGLEGSRTVPNRELRARSHNSCGAIAASRGPCAWQAQPITPRGGRSAC